MLIELAKAILPRTNSQHEETITLLSNLYVKYLLRPFPQIFLYFSEERRFLTDIIHLKSILEENGSCSEYKPKSKRLKNLFSKHNEQGDKKINNLQIQNETIIPNQHYISAFLLIHLFYKNRSEDLFKWIISSIISIIAAISAYEIIIEFIF